MDERIDSGDILFQKPVPIPEGITGSQLEARCAVAGGGLLRVAVCALIEGRAVRRPQPVEGSSYESWPQQCDLEVSPTRPACWAFRFIRGVSDWYPLTVPLPEGPLRIRGALGYVGREGEQGEPTLRGRPSIVQGDEAWIRFSPGLLHVSVRQSGM